MLKSSYDGIEQSRLIAHLSCENREFSRIACKKALIGLNKASADETHTYIRVICLLLVVRDTLKHIRCEWLLGIPQARLERPVLYNQQGVALPKMGVDTMRNVNDEICVYVSTLFKTQSSMKESYLQLLVSYKNKWAKFVMEGVISLLSACV